MNNFRSLKESSTDSLVSLSICDIGQYSAFVLTLCAGTENRWNGDFVTALRKALQRVATDPSGHVLITRSSSEKFFSNGLDMKFLKPNADFSELNGVMPSFADVLDLPIPTLCVLQGHAFGAGMMFALAHDYRIQATTKGFMCANEIEIGIGIPPPEMALFAHAMSAPDFYSTVLDAKRWGGKEAFERGIVHAIGSTPEEIDEQIVKLAGRVARLGKNRKVMGQMKKQVKGHIANGLRNFGELSKI